MTTLWCTVWHKALFGHNVSCAASVYLVLKLPLECLNTKCLLIFCYLLLPPLPARKNYECFVPHLYYLILFVFYFPKWLRNAMYIPMVRPFKSWIVCVTQSPRDIAVDECSSITIKHVHLQSNTEWNHNNLTSGAKGFCVRLVYCWQLCVHSLVQLVVKQVLYWWYTSTALHALYLGSMYFCNLSF